MLRKIRVLVAIISIVVLTLLFLDFTGITQQYCGWLAKIQLVPALLSLNVVAVIFLLLLTLLMGRVYCSVICPLGIIQDVINSLRGKIGKKKNRKNRFNYIEPKSWLRFGVLVVFVFLIILGLCNIISMTMVSFIEPYSAYGRIASSLFAPIYNVGNNLVADAVADSEYYWFYDVETFVSLHLIIVAFVTILIVGTMAWIGGRIYCNTICPVGTLLGFFSRFSVLKPVIDVKKCNGCQKCARNCKSSCIDAKKHVIDYSRCVVCLDCVNNCSTGAISYKVRSALKTNDEISKHNIDDERRNFIATGLALATATAVKATDKITDGGLAKIIDKEAPQRKSRIVPPGAVSLSHLQRHCTGCQLCISACDNKVLSPSHNLDTFMQPIVQYNNGYCRPECVKCSDICPAGAFHSITVAEKSSIQIGRAIVNLDACIMSSQGKQCGNCSRRCPSGAIILAPLNPEDENSRYMPVVNEAKCIGCGACEYYCPVRPLSAIYVEGNEAHRMI